MHSPSKTSPKHRSGEILESLYQQRKKRFAEMLERTIQILQSDQIGKQMLQNKTSGVYIANRIEEIIEQMLKDDRENFIEQLLYKIKVFETLYKEEQAEIEKLLGDEIYSLPNSPSLTQNRSRYIHILIDAVRELQGQNTKLKQSNQEKDKLLRGVGKHRRIDYNSQSPYFMHLFSEIDVTDLDSRVRAISSDLTTTRNSVISMQVKTRKTIAIVMKKTREAIEVYEERTNKLESRYRRSQQKVQLLQRSLEDLSAQKEAEIERLMIALNEREDKEKSSKSLVQMYEKEIQKLAKEVNDLKSENEQLGNKIFTLESNEKKLKSALTTAEAERATAQAEADRNAESNTELDKQLQQMRTNTKSLTRSLELERERTSELRGEIDDREEKIDQFQTKLKGANKSLKEVKAQFEAEKQHSAEVEGAVKKLNQTVKQLKTDLQQTENRAKVAESEVESLRESLESNSNQLGSELAKAKKQNVLLSQSRDQIAAQLEEVQSKLVETESQLSAAKSEIRQKNSEVSETEKKVEEVQVQLQEEIEAAQKQIQSITKSRDDQTVVVAQLREQIDELQGELEKTQNDLNQAKLESKQKAVEAAGIRATADEEVDALRTELSQKISTVDALTKANMDLKSKLASANEMIDEHVSEITEQRTRISENEKLIDKLRQSKAASRDESERMQSQVIDLTQQVNDLNGVIRKQKADMDRIAKEKEGEIDSKQHEIEEVEAELEHTKSDLSTVLQTIGASSVPDVAKVMRVMSNISAGFSDALRALNADKNTVMDRIDDLNKQSLLLSKIETQIGPLEKLNALKREHDSLCDVLNTNSNIVESVKSVIDSRGAAVDQLKDTNEFVSKVFTTITGQPQSPRRFTTPLPESRKMQLLSTLQKSADAAVANRNAIDQIVNEATLIGYGGSDPREAVDFIIRQRCNSERQGAMIDTSKKIDDMRREFDERMEELTAKHRREIEAKAKDISDMRKSIIDLSEKRTQEREDAELKMSELEKQIRGLTDELNTEKSLRQELGRLGAGATADKRLLKSKLSAQEYKLIEFVEKIMKSEREAKAIHENMRRVRQDHLGTVVKE